jgi:lambda family phage tail tape measure protein
MAAGSIVIDLLMKTGSFETDTKRAEKRLKEFEKSAEKVGKALGGAFVAGTTALAVATTQYVKSAKELNNLSRLSGVAAEQFQKLSYASKTVGIEQEKLSDIFKDVQDRVGDFIQTGGGAMADFFENIAPKIGVTIEQFRELSGADALGLFYSSLEKANLSQSEMIFFMEQMASDSSLLIPLLQNNSAEFRRLGEELERTGGIMSESGISQAIEFDKQLNTLTASVKSLGIAVVQEILPALQDYTDIITNAWIQSDELRNQQGQIVNSGIGAFFDGLATSIAVVADAMVGLVKLAGAVSGSFSAVAADIKALSAGATALAMNVTPGMSFFDPEGIEQANREFQDALTERDRIVKDANQRYIDLWNYDGARFYNAVKDSQLFRGAGLGGEDPLSADLPPSSRPLAPIRPQVSKDQEKLDKMLETVKKITVEFEREREFSMYMLSVREQMVGMTEDERRIQEAVNEVLDSTNQKLDEISRQRLDAANAGANQTILSQFDDQAEAVKNLGEQYAELARIQESSAISAQRTFAFGWSTALNQYIEDASNAALVAKSTFDSLTTNLSNAIATFVETGKLSFSDLAQSIVSDILRIQLQAQVSQIFGYLTSAIGSAAAGFFGSGQVASGASPLTVNQGMGYGGFAEGGYTGMGGKYEPAGVVHRGEFVMNADATKRLGVGFLDRLNKGYANGGYVGNAKSVSSGVVINIKNEAGADGYQATAQARQNSDGGLNIDVLVRRVVSSDISNNGALAQQMANTFGLRRAI